ncbi:PAP5 [Auxenochlorella protothecoides x Auxenochlorella symbiontica]
MAEGGNIPPFQGQPGGNEAQSNVPSPEQDGRRLGKDLLSRLQAVSVQSPGPQRLGPGSSLGPHLPGPAHPGVPPSYLDVHHAGMHPLFGAQPPPWQPWGAHQPHAMGPSHQGPYTLPPGMEMAAPRISLDSQQNPARVPSPMEGSLQRDSVHRQLIQVQVDPGQPAPPPLIHQPLQPPPGFSRPPFGVPLPMPQHPHPSTSDGQAQAHPWTHPVHPPMAPAGPPLPMLPPLVEFPGGRLLTREEAAALQGPLSRQLDGLLAAATQLIEVGQAASPAVPLLLRGLEATKAQLGAVAQTLSQHQNPDSGSEAAPAAGGEPAAEGDVPHAEQAKAGEVGPGQPGGAASTASMAKHGGARKEPYKPAPGREGRWVDIMDARHDGRRPVTDLNRLNAGLMTLLQSLTPTTEELAVQDASLQKVTLLLKEAWPGANVELFGSVANGLSVRGTNDLDICMQLPESSDTKESKVEAALRVAETVREAGMEDVKDLPGARIPVVKFGLPGTALRVDVTIDNDLACANTRYLAAYAAIDPRFRQLVTIVKHWAKRRKVNEPYTGTLSSYCYALMCVHLLQTRSPPILPALQLLPHTHTGSIQGWDVGYYDKVETLQDFGNANTQTLAELVWDFFEYWAWGHDYRSTVISVRTAGTLTKTEKGWAQRVGRERHLVCIEDPFELSHDLGRTVDRQTSGVLRKEFLRAATLLRDSPNPLHQLFERFIGKHHAET